MAIYALDGQGYLCGDDDHAVVVVVAAIHALFSILVN